MACIDGSGYANSVCDHAAWMAGRMEGDVSVVHVANNHRPQTAIVTDAVRRLHEEGSPTAKGHPVEGHFPLTAINLAADLIVMGKRGENSEADSHRLGSSVGAMIHETSIPLCLTSKLFLPISRAVVLLDADMRHRSAVELVAAHTGLQKLEIDLVVAARGEEDAEPKLRWARHMLAARDADVFAMNADGPDAAAAKYMEQSGADLVVISRAVLAPNPQGRLGRIGKRGVWGWRTPVLVC